MAKTKTTAPKAVKEEKKKVIPEKETTVTVTVPENKTTATVIVPSEYAALNVRDEPNGKIVGELKDGCTVNVLDIVTVNDERWAQIGEKQFVNRFYLKM